MPPEIRRLHPLSWLFITASSIRGLIMRLIVPLIAVLFASSFNPVARFELLGLLVIAPVFVVAIIQQRIYNYRFDEDELVVRDGILTKKERHIPYERVHNVALVRNPFHRMLGVASARIETAAGGKPEAVMRVLSLEAVEELRRYTLGQEPAAVPAPADADEDETSPAAPAAPAELLKVTNAEFVRLGLISNRGFLVVAAVLGLLSQVEWWEQDWEAYYEIARDAAPGWARSVTDLLLQPGSWTPRILFVLGLVILVIVLVRVLSIAWYLVRYHGFTLVLAKNELRIDFGLLTHVSSLIPVHRIQLLTAGASWIHRWFGRAEIDLETAGSLEEGDGDLSGAFAESGVKTSRQWMAPILPAEAAHALVRRVMPEIDMDAVEWRPISPRAARRIIKKGVLLVAVVTLVMAVGLAFAPVPGGSLHALWFPAVVLPLVFLGVPRWVRNGAYAITDTAVFFRSGWLSRKISVVRLDKMQSVWLSESPFDRRYRMASVKVDTAGAGSMGHRIDIPYIDLDEAQAIARRLYAEARATEFRW